MQTKQEKLVHILKNGIQALVKRDFENGDLQYTLTEAAHTWGDWRKEKPFRGIMVPAYLFSLDIALTDYASCTVNLPAQIDPIALKRLAALNALSGEERIEAFKCICKEEQLEHKVTFNTKALFKRIESLLNTAGAGVFKVLRMASSERDINVALIFSKRHSAEFQFCYDIHQDFCNRMTVFADTLREHPHDTQAELNALIEKSRVRSYWVMTKRVIRWMQSDKTRLPSERMTVQLKTALFCEDEHLEHVRLPDGLKYIPDEMFKGCINLKSVYIPDSVEKIGSKAFFGCESLEEVQLPLHLKEIGDEAFAFCVFSKSVYLPEGCKKLGHHAFWSTYGYNRTLTDDDESYYDEEYDDYNDYDNYDNYDNYDDGEDAYYQPLLSDNYVD